MSQISYFGNEQLLQRTKTAFLCSRNAPDDIYPALKQWISSLHPEQHCIVCGTLSGTERLVIRQCAEKHISLIIILAESMPETLNEAALKLPHVRLSTLMGEGRLLIMSVNSEDTDKDASARNAELRNRWMFNCCEHIVVGYVHTGGRLSTQLLGIRHATYLTPPPTPQATTAEDTFRYGWSIYHYISTHVLNMPSHEIRAKLLAYLRLGIAAPSPLHSSILLLVTKSHQHIGTEFNFPVFFDMWGGVDKLREEDWTRHKSPSGTYYPSIAEKALHLLEKAQPRFQRPDLTRRMAAEALKHYPNNSHYRQLVGEDS